MGDNFSLSKDKNFLVTGGTGSFGSTMVKHLLKAQVNSVTVFSRDEAKQDAMRRELGDARLRFFIGDTRDRDSLSAALKGIDAVFHAAALKQVPSAEFFPMEAVKTNIIGSQNLIAASMENDVEAVVCLSTDKAVEPINAMGMSKGLMEKIAVSFARDARDAKTRVMVTRYGNVLYSRGSVVPLFVNQIRQGHPLTITNPTMTRFLMTLHESVDLVRYAFEKGNSGEVLIRKAPACTILDLAVAVRELMGQPEHPIVTLGTRHGEKVYESLLSGAESANAVDDGDFFRIPVDSRDLNYGLYFDRGKETRAEGYTSENTTRLSVSETKKMLLALPEFADFAKRVD